MDSPIGLVGFVTRSTNRVATIRALVDGPQTRPELQETTGIPRATLSRILADFWKQDLLTKDGHHYQLSTLGEYLASQLDSMAERIETIRRLQSIEQWLPVDAFDFDLVDLSDAEVIRQTPADPHAPVARILPVLEDAGHVRGLCDNAVHEAIVAEWRAITAGRQRFEGVLTTEVIDVIVSDPERMEQAGEVFAADDTEAFVYDGEIPGLVIIADETVLLEAADEDGAIKAFILTDNPAVRSWAETAFEDYKQSADPIGVEVLTS